MNQNNLEIKKKDIQLYRIFLLIASIADLGILFSLTNNSFWKSEFLFLQGWMLGYYMLGGISAGILALIFYMFESRLRNNQKIFSRALISIIILIMIPLCVWGLLAFSLGAQGIG